MIDPYKQKHAKRAKEDIKCMKVVVKSFEDPEHPTFHSIFVNSDFQYRIGKVAKDQTPKISPIYPDCVNIGLHTFRVNVDGWKRLAKYFENARENGMFDQEWGYVKTEAAVLECVIPKGTLYFEGRANCILGDDEEKGYTSSKLIPVREVPRSEWETYG